MVRRAPKGSWVSVMVWPRRRLAVLVVSIRQHVIETVGVLFASHDLSRTDIVPVSDTAGYRRAMSTLAAPRRLRITVVALIAAVALIGTACSPSTSSTGDLPNLDDDAGTETAPDFTVTTLDGVGFSLFDHLENDGRPVFLNMWASWCPPCRAEMPDIDAAAESHPDVKFIGVAANDDPAESAEFALSIGIGYTIGFDEDGSVARSYKVVGLPASYVISAEGVILEQIFGSITEAEINELLAKWFD